jgi:hypothetical protein
LGEALADRVRVMEVQMTAVNPVSAFISSVYSTPIECPGCGAHAHLMRRAPSEIGTELRSFECEVCKQKTDIVVFDRPWLDAAAGSH